MQPLIKPFMVISFIATLILGEMANAHDMNSLYQLAKQEDYRYKAAYHHLQATLQKVPEARADLLPTLKGEARTRKTHTNTSNANYHSKKIEWTLNQPLIDLKKWLAYKEANYDIKAAFARFNQAHFDLILRLAKQYFNTLVALDALKTSQHLLDNAQARLDNNQKRIAMGCDCDRHDLKQAYDKAKKDHIDARNSYEDEQDNFYALIGQRVGLLHTVNLDLEIVSPDPNEVSFWLDTAAKHNQDIAALSYELKGLSSHIQQSQSSHLPTLNVEANTSREITSSTSKSTYTSDKVGLKLSIPIFSGGGIIAKTQKARHQYEEKSYLLQQKHRDIRSQVKQTFRKIQSKRIESETQQQLVLSSKATLEATQNAYLRGSNERTILNVIEQEKAYFADRKENFKIYYDYLLLLLKLKSLNGSLNDTDINLTNEWVLGD